MKIVGIDWGSRRIGIAYANRNIASPLKILKARDQQDGLEQLKNLVRDMNVEKIVLGVPLDSDGKETKQSRKIKEIGKKLEKITKVDVNYWNEALTSKQALRGKLEGGHGQNSRKELDAVSAAYILQSYLDSEKQI